jgi:hypothetical protein
MTEAQQWIEEEQKAQADAFRPLLRRLPPLERKKEEELCSNRTRPSTRRGAIRAATCAWRALKKERE